MVISVLDSAKQLTANILRTRKTVKYYVIFSLSMVLLTFLMLIVGIYFSDNVLETLGLVGKMDSIPIEKAKFIIMASFAIFGVLFTLALGGIYFLLYGLLTRKTEKKLQGIAKIGGLISTITVAPFLVLRLIGSKLILRNHF